MKSNFFARRLAVGASVFALFASATAIAQTPEGGVDDADSQTILVTGSRLARPSYDQVQPILTIATESIEERGITTIAQALTQAPGFGIPASSLIGNQGNGFGAGQAFVDLYSLGSQRTLTLVNGRRFVGANPASIFSQAEAGVQVDLNTIPTKIVSRVETVGVGGAPIYGSDAIAGTVNIILRKNFTGVDLDAQAGVSGRGDLFNYRGRALAGTNFAGDRGNITATVEYINETGIIGSSRAALRAQTGFIAPLDPDSPFQQVLIRNQRTFLGVEGGNPYFLDRGRLGPTRSIVDASGNLVRFGPDGNLVTFNTGTPTNDPTTFIGGDGLDFSRITNLKVDSQRVNVAAFVNYELNDKIRVYGEGWYSNNKATNLTGQPVYNTGFFRAAPAGTFDVNGNFIVRLNNPFLTPQARALIQQNLEDQGLPSDPNDPDAVFYLGRANTDLVSGVARLNQDLYRLVGGVAGELNLLGTDWTWDASINYGRTRSASSQPSLVESNLRRALTVQVVGGQIVCAPFNPDPADPTAPPNTPQFNGTISTACAPLNLFGQGAPSQAARDYVTTNARTVAITSQRDVLLTAQGSIAKLPGGDLAISIGYENRREFSGFRPDEYYTGALGRTIPILGISGSYVTNEVFGEARLPLIGPDQNIPLVHSFNVNGAARWVNNSIAGSAVTWTAGASWQPIEDVTIRGNFTRSIRAPAVTELFVSNQPAFDGGFDPCDSQNLTGGPNPARRQANCAAAGLPADFSSIINSVTVPINVLGNGNLRNESAKSWTIGAVLQPRIVRNLSLAVDYINISLRDRIVASSATDVLSGCYDASDFPNNFFCGLITRDTDPDNFGQVLTLDEPYINQGGLSYRSIQTSFNWNLDLWKDANLSLGANYQYLIDRFNVISAATGRTQLDGNIGLSKHRFNFEATLDAGPINWFNQVRYVGPARFDVTEAPGTRDVPGVGGWAVWNSAISVKIAEKMTFRFSIDNVTDVGLPFPGSGNGVQQTYTEGLLGRTFLVGVNVKY